MITVLMARGTGEPVDGPNNMLRLVTSRLDPAKFEIGADCPYPASVGPANQTGNPLGPSEDESIRLGIPALAAMIRACPNKVGLLGYSLGAELVSKFLEAQASGEYADCELAFTACAANPVRAEGDSIEPNPVGYGINGPHGPFPAGVTHLEAANPADMITSCPEGSPLRTLADQVSAFSFAALGGWTQDLVQKLLKGRFQPSSVDWWTHPIRTWDLYEEAAIGVQGYLTRQTHIEQYIEDGYCSRLAAAINAL
jgi:hypothetical protein